MSDHILLEVDAIAPSPTNPRRIFRPLAPGCKLCRPCLAVQANDNARRVRS